MASALPVSAKYVTTNILDPSENATFRLSRGFRPLITPCEGNKMYAGSRYSGISQFIIYPGASRSLSCFIRYPYLHQSPGGFMKHYNSFMKNIEHKWGFPLSFPLCFSHHPSVFGFPTCARPDSDFAFGFSHPPESFDSPRSGTLPHVWRELLALSYGLRLIN